MHMHRTCYRTWIKLTLFIILLFNVSVAYGNDLNKSLPIDKYTKKYDILFRKATKKYFGPGFDYRQWKAQGMAESRLKPDAISPVGAKGIMQIMDFTQFEQATEGTAYEPKWAIPVGIKYDRQLYNQQTSPRPHVDRIAFTLGSYNAGLGNILKGQKECNKHGISDCNLQLNIIEYGEDVSSWKSEETKGYVERIMMYMDAELSE